jgi:hypothetical protein
MKTSIKRLINFFGLQLGKYDPKMIKPVDTKNVEILENTAFQKSVEEVRSLTLLDTARLANLWNLCSLTDPKGAIIEIGSYRGGGALHLSNCCPNRKIYICDSFGGFEQLHDKLDNLFKSNMFLDNTKNEVEALFANKKRDAEVIAGFFPESCRHKKLEPISFVHLDVDVYKATQESLHFLAPLMMAQSIIVLDDYQRNAQGVDLAVQEFVAKNPDWTVFPLFPSQGALVRTLEAVP